MAMAARAKRLINFFDYFVALGGWYSSAFFVPGRGNALGRIRACLGAVTERFRCLT